MFKAEYSARSESNVVNEPAPASSGKTSGTYVASLIGPAFLKISISNTISIAIRKSTKAPATANEFISTPKRFSKPSPMKKKRHIRKSE